MLSYTYDNKTIQIQETKNGDDIEFHLQVMESQQQEYVAKLKKVRHFFESDDVYTDVLVYQFPNHRFSVIVRPQFRIDFLLQLMKHRILQRLEWTESEAV